MIKYKIYDNDIDNELHILNKTMKKYKLQVRRIGKNNHQIDLHKKENNDYYTTIMINKTKLEIYQILCCIETFLKYKEKKY